MDALTAAAVLALAVQCAPTAPRDKLVAIAQTESGLHPLALNDNTTHRSYTPDTIQQAASFATTLIMQGHNIDLGLMQINSRNLSHVGLTISGAFDACASLKAGAMILEEDYQTAFSLYNTGTATRGFANGYVSRVVAHDNALRSTPDRIAPTSPPPKPEGIFADSGGQNIYADSQEK